jgi:hypothetical protein
MPLPLFAAPPEKVLPEEWYRFRTGMYLCSSGGTVNLRIEGSGGRNHTVCLPPDESEAFIMFFRKIAVDAKKQAACAAKETPASATSPAPTSRAPPLAPQASVATGDSIFD